MAGAGDGAEPLSAHVVDSAVLFLVASLITGTPILPQAQHSDIYLTGLGMLLTTVYIPGLIFRPRGSIARMGPDSLAVLVLYAIGIAGLVAIAA